MAQLVLPIAGAVIGTIIAPGIGTSIGWAAGSVLSGVVFPEKINAPKLPDVHGTLSSYGTPIPRIWGRMPSSVNIVWPAGDRIYTTHEQESSGKGGPTVVSQTRTATFRALFCRSNGTHRVTRLWNFGELIYDAREGVVVTGSDLPFVFYNGDPDQAADPTEEAIEGVGMVPAYRGWLTMVATDWDVTKWATVQLKAEISSTGTSPVALHRVNTFASEFITPTHFPSISWDGEQISVSNFAGNFPSAPFLAWFHTHAAWGSWVTDHYTEAGVYVDTTTVTISSVPGFSPPDNSIINKCQEDARTFAMTYATGTTIGNTILFFVDGVKVGEGVDLVMANGSSGTTQCFTAMDHSNGQRAYYMLLTDNLGNGVTIRRMFGPNATLSDPSYVVDLVNAASGFHLATGTDGHIYVGNGSLGVWKFDEELNLIQHWTTGAQWLNTTGVPAAAVPKTQAFFCGDLCVYYGGSGVAQIPGGPGTGIHRINVAQVQDTQPWPLMASLEYTTHGALQANVAGVWNLGLGLSFVQDGLLSICETEEDLVRLMDIVSDVHEECGHVEADDFNVDELPDPVRGYGQFDIMTGKALVETLQPLFAFDATLIDGKCTYVKRGHQSVVTVPSSDLAARGESGEPLTPLQLIRGNDDELPSQGYINYYNAGADNLKGTQTWHRSGTDSRIVRVVTAPVSLNDAEAKARINWICEDAWNSRNGYKWTLTKKYLWVTPTDVMTVEGIPLSVRRMEVMEADGVIAFEGFRSKLGLYASGAPAGESEGFAPQEIPEAQATELAMLDGPFIGDDWRHGVVPIAAQGALRRSWRGMGLFKSLDGTNYSQVMSEAVAGTIGECVTKLENFGGPSFDEGNILRVRIHPGGGELVSVTRDATMAGANLCMIGHEVINYRTADLVSEDDNGRVYDLSGLLRGRYGTEWAMRGHGPSLDSPTLGERFVALPTHSTLPLLRSDLGITRQYKPVTIGQTLASTTAYPFRSNGIPLAPYSPRFLSSGLSGESAEDVLMRWTRRSRINQGWPNFRAPTGMGQPLGEETEAYRVRIWADGTYQTVIRTETVMNATEFTYTLAMQTEDFGSPLPTRYAWSVAQIGSLGPGYEAFANGFVADIPLFVPDTIDGYVPPNPPSGNWTTDTMPWVEATQRNYAGLQANDTLVIAFTTANVASGTGGLVQLSGAELSGPPVPRQWTLSPVPGDFGPQTMPGAQSSGSPSITALFVVGSGNDYGYYPTVPLMATWYLNIRNLPSGYTANPLFARLLNVP